MSHTFSSKLIKFRMMRMFLVLTLILSYQSVKSQELRNFLSSCGYGTLAGAGVGLASLVFEKKPNENYNNIARGASFGLYFGIGYGAWLSTQESHSMVDSFSYLTSPAVKQRKKKFDYLFMPSIDGAQVLFLYKFI